MLVIVLLIISYFVFFSNNQQKEQETKLYQGPVQPGYNETLFRETGVYQKETNSLNGA